MIIKYYTKQNYGSDVYYLIGSPEARAILNITKQKTISKYQMLMFNKLGITFEEVLKPKN